MNFLKRLQINQVTWENLAQNRPPWKRTEKTIYEANRIVAAKANRDAHTFHVPSICNIATQPHPTCPRCQRTFRERIGFVSHLRAQSTNRPDDGNCCLYDRASSNLHVTTSTPTLANVALNACHLLPSTTTTSITCATGTLATTNTPTSATAAAATD
ncbi:hypothetical protein SprV_0200567100 [Sparganum proliferum]